MKLLKTRGSLRDDQKANQQAEHGRQAKTDLEQTADETEIMPIDDMS